MTKKIFSLFTFAMLIIGFIGIGGINKAHAADSDFPQGCSSALGYSVTTGSPCNGTNSATVGFLPGCTTALGYSTLDGRACSGSSVALQYLAGCTSTFGYSTRTGAACNGTSVATILPVTPTPTTPGLPLTGAGGNAPLNLFTLIVSGILVVSGFVYLAYKPKAVK
ncbi:MAG TPA: hypothetical protein VK153_02725 [Candidatus Paceibacterota bacterium]|nr:hypothetical protein [Candidatus Paceibacterota bacterium]